MNKNKKVSNVYIRDTTSGLAIFLVLISTFIAALAQVFFKLATLNSSNSLLLSFLSPYFFISVVLITLNLFVFTASLRLGNLSTLYPFTALSFVWVALMSVYWLKEVITLLRFLSIVLIISGVLVIGLKSRTHGVSI